MDEYLESNRRLWNDWTGIHEKSEFYDIEGFKANPLRLHPIEQEELGDVRGKSLLHLQCHFGMDTLSWATLGATVTGADFSDKAIDLARKLSAETGIPANFVCSNIYDLPNVLQGQFDIVFTSHGVLGWLPDIPQWAQIVAHFLKPGGTFYVAEVHPFAYIFDDAHPTELKTKYPYFQKEPLKLDVRGSYADPDNAYRGVEYGWTHTISDYINALLGAGLQIEFLHEHPFLTWQAFPFMEKDPQRYWRLKDGSEMIPLMFTLRARKSGT